MSYDLEIRSAGTILQRRFNAPVSLQLHRLVAGGPDERMAILRCAVSDCPAGRPDTFIVKRWRERPDHLRRECASLDFLGRQEETRPIFPELYGWDAQAETMVVEDLGDREGQWLGDILFADDREKAERALIEFQRAVGRMHAATMGKKNEFLEVCKLYGAQQDEGDRTDKLPGRLLLFERNVRELGFEGAPGLTQDIENVVGLMENPGPFLAFVHGDTTLANTFLTDRGIRIYDLESGGMRHCLTDGVFSRMRYLESSLAQRIPIDLQRRMMNAYREELSSGCPGAMDDDLFLPAFTACCACWMAEQCGRLPANLEKDDQWGRASERQRVVTALENFTEISAEFELLEALGKTAASMAQELRNRWSETECSLPVYKALLL